MSFGDDLNSEAPWRGSRLRFSLLALLIVVTLVSLGLAWFVQPNRVVATTLFQVDSSESDGLGGRRALTSGEFEILKQTQVAKLKSNFVLTAAVRTPTIAGLGVLANRKDPIEWIHDHLEVDFPGNSEIMAIRLHGVEEHAADLVAIADAVAKAYRSEVVDEMRQRRLAERDLLGRNVEKLNREIKQKLEMLLDISRETGRPLGRGNALLEIDARQFELNAAELLRLESESALADSTDTSDRAKKLEKRIAQLREAQMELAKRINAGSDVSADTELRQKELEQLQRLSSDMSVKLEQLEIESSSPETIRLLQPAVISRE
ncbi:MAG: hypothetical protein U0805_20500 [Pirellulales bacterium]